MTQTEIMPLLIKVMYNSKATVYNTIGSIS